LEVELGHDDVFTPFQGSGERLPLRSDDAAVVAGQHLAAPTRRLALDVERGGGAVVDEAMQ
jgi:hypothetical protein